MIASPERALRPIWEGEVLDFLSLRGSLGVVDWPAESIPALVRRLSGTDWQTLLAAQTLANPWFLEDLRTAYQLAPRELEQTRERTRRPTRGRLYGQPDMRATIRTRQRRQDPTIWIVGTPVRRWQTDDNAAIVGWLDFIRRAAGTFAGRPTSSWHAAVSRAESGVERLLRSEPLRHVMPSPYWSSHQMSRTLVSRSRFYATVWKWAEAWREAAQTRDASVLRRVVRRGWLAAEDDDQLFELFVLSRLVVVLHRLGPWETFDLRLAMTGSDTILRAEQHGIRCEVRFDRAPKVPSRYKWLFDRYGGVDAAVRRPDLQLSVTVGDGPARHALIEVKATAPSTKYGRDSMYKVLGYLKDYEELWAGQPATYPRAVLVLTTGTRPTAPLSLRVAEDEILLSDHATIEADLHALVLRLADID